MKIAAENIGPEIAENAQCKRSNNIAGGSATSEDVTVDLQSPRSKSGQHWKREYHRNHDKSKTEMGKLIKYSQVTKSYAVKRDADATRLAEKLNRAETRLKEMEKRVSDLASQLVSSRAQEDSQSDIINELTAQTAETLRYKRKAEKYRLALQMQDEQQGRENGDGPRLNGELSVDDLSKIVNLRAEIASLREVAEKAEDRATDLDRENQALKGTLARVKEEMKSYEIRYKAREEARKKRNERTAAKQKELKNQLEASRSENQQLQLQLRSKNQASTSHLLEEIADLKEKLRRQTARSAKSSEISRERRKEPRLASKQYGLEPQVSLLPQVGDWRQRDMGFNARCENQRLEPSSPVDLMNLGRFTRETVKEPVPTVSNQAGKTPQTMDEAVQESSDIWTLPKPRLTKPLNIDQEYERPLSPINQNTSKPQGAARPSRSPLAGSQATARPRVSQRRARREIASAVAGSEQTKGPTYSEGLSKPAEQILQKARERQQRREQKDAGKGKENLSPLNW